MAQVCETMGSDALGYLECGHGFTEATVSGSTAFQILCNRASRIPLCHFGNILLVGQSVTRVVVMQVIRKTLSIVSRICIYIYIWVVALD